VDGSFDEPRRGAFVTKNAVFADELGFVIKAIFSGTEPIIGEADSYTWLSLCYYIITRLHIHSTCKSVFHSQVDCLSCSLLLVNLLKGHTGHAPLDPVIHSSEQCNFVFKLKIPDRCIGLLKQMLQQINIIVTRSCPICTVFYPQHIRASKKIQLWLA